VEKSKKDKYAIWALTHGGFKLARHIMKELGTVDLYLSERLANVKVPCFRFESLKAKLTGSFNQYRGHIFIMATGIVVRIIAPLIKDKTVDPAVVVLDERCNHCISLLSGHLGGANELARQIAQIVDAVPVITTATDVNDVPSIDLIAKEFDLAIENPDAIKIVNMALLERKTIEVFDPYRLLKDSLPAATATPTQTLNAVELRMSSPDSSPTVFLGKGPGGDPPANASLAGELQGGHIRHWRAGKPRPYEPYVQNRVGAGFIPARKGCLNSTALTQTLPLQGGQGEGKAQPMIYVGDEIKELPPTCLVLRPRILVAGIGCNRNTGGKEIKDFLLDVFRRYKLSMMSLSNLATIDIKRREKGLIELAAELGIPITFFSSDELNEAKGLETPSNLVEKYTGAQSVCEAAALLGAKTSKLLAPKQAAKDVTVAVARTVCM
jgi:cobalamin biosynthesis protein CbiG